MPQSFLDPNMCFLTHLCIAVFPNSGVQLAKLIVYIIPLELICVVVRWYWMQIVKIIKDKYIYNIKIYIFQQLHVTNANHVIWHENV